MANLEKLDTPELSPEEEVIKESRESIEDLKDELPFTKEEVKKAFSILRGNLKPAIWAAERAEQKLKRLVPGLKNRLKKLESDWFLKLSKEEKDRVQWIGEKLFSNTHLFYTEESGEVYLNPDTLFEEINALDKQDRKLVKKIVKIFLKKEYKWSKRQAKWWDKYAKMNVEAIKEERKEINRRIN